MTKSSNTERAQKVNMAITLLKENITPTVVATTLATQYGMSKRQAYRYVKEAESTDRLIPVPDQKIAFTVKLSRNLTRVLREYVKVERRTLSGVVTQALEAFLYKGRRRGQAEGKDSKDRTGI